MDDFPSMNGNREQPPHRQYSIANPLWMSFYSKALYRDVATSWKGTGLLYLLMLLALGWLPISAQIHLAATKFASHEAPALVEQIPVVEITDGKLSIDRRVPYYIKIPGTDKTLIAIDTSGKLKSLEDTDAQMLVTETRMHLRNEDSSTETMELADFEGFRFDADTALEWVRFISSYFAAVSYPFFVLISFVSWAMKLLVVAALGMLIAKVLKVSLLYGQLFRLSAVASTPAIVLNTVLASQSFGLGNLTCGPLGFVITLGFLFFAVYANSDGDAGAGEPHDITRFPPPPSVPPPPKPPPPPPPPPSAPRPDV